MPVRKYTLRLPAAVAADCRGTVALLQGCVLCAIDPVNIRQGGDQRKHTRDTNTRPRACTEEENVPPDGFMALPFLKKPTAQDADKFALLKTSQSEVDQAAGAGHVKVRETTYTTIACGLTAVIDRLFAFLIVRTRTWWFDEPWNRLDLVEKIVSQGQHNACSPNYSYIHTIYMYTIRNNDFPPQNGIFYFFYGDIHVWYVPYIRIFKHTVHLMTYIYAIQ